MTTSEIITIGDELLIGQVLNTNVAWIAQQLSALGINIIRDVTVGDDENEILRTLKECYSECDVVVVTGGLGPTKDDITKGCACKLFNCGLTFNEEAFQNVVNRFKNLGYEITESNRMQAMVPDKCIPLQNHNGTAPGMLFKENVDGKTKIMVFLPGVPLEMKGLIEDYVLDILKDTYQNNGLYYRTVLTQGKGESFIAEIIKDWEASLPENVKLAYLPQYGSVRLRITAYGSDLEKNKAIVNKELEKLVRLIPEWIYGYDDDTIEHAVGVLLKKDNLTIATAESCTGGNIAHHLTLVPGSSDYFKGSIVAYSEKIKNDVLGVRKETISKYGVVSKETAEEMSQCARKLMNTDVAIATTGYAGPGGGDETSQVGTVWISVAGRNFVTSEVFHFGTNREINIKRTTYNALKMVYNCLRDKKLQ